MTTPYKKKLIEVALPLEDINREATRHGHPSMLHLWWARRPLAACRAETSVNLSVPDWLRRVASIQCGPEAATIPHQA